MFTGLVEAVGQVAAARREGAALRLAVRAALGGPPPRPGDSIAVDGVCLTVRSRRGARLDADVVARTLAGTTLGALSVGDRVNLERSLRAGDLLGGHLLLGHVDGTVRVVRIRRAAGDWRVRFDLPADLARFVAGRGSVALAGVSLTVADLGRRWFEVALVPTTLARTTLGRLAVGNRVNIEVDLLARYLERLAGART